MIRFLTYVLLTAFISLSATSSFAAAGISVKAKASKGGMIAPSGNVPITAGQNLVFTIAPTDAAAYEIADVLVNGQSQGPVSQYTFSNVTSKQSIIAKFKKKSYTQTVINGDPSLGSLTPQGSVASVYGKSIAITAKPIKNYKAAITVDGVVVATGSVNKPLKYKLRVDAGHTISAYFYNDAAPLNVQRNVPATVAPPASNTASDATASSGAAPANNNNGQPADSSSNNDVSPISIGIKLNWAIPTARTDGQALAVADIAGYEVYYTNLEANDGDVVFVDGATLTSAVVMVPGPGIYYFSISTIDNKGEKSELSELVQVTVK